jgi:hypothetical protein
MKEYIKSGEGKMYVEHLQKNKEAFVIRQPYMVQMLPDTYDDNEL